MKSERSWAGKSDQQSSRQVSNAFDYLGRMSACDMAEMQRVCAERVNQGNQANQRGQE